MGLPQPGIFAVGTTAHSYLELDLLDSASPSSLVETAAALSQRETTMGAVNLVVGFAPAVWEEVCPGTAPSGLRGFDAPVVGQDGFAMPAVQHDLALWFAGASYDIVFDASVDALGRLAGCAAAEEENAGWSYRRDRDLTGFIDGTENPPIASALGYALVPDGKPGAGGSVLLLQKWRHDVSAWTALSDKEQELVIGRTKPDSVELDDKPDTSHVARTDQADFGHILRRNTAYGTVSEHGTMFVGFAASQAPLQAMLQSMAGVHGPRDALTRYSEPLTGAYYFVPSAGDLTRLAPA
jgi:putative iron-dependent peroxidase